MFLAQPIMISLKASMELKEHNPHCQVQSWSSSINQTIDSYKKNLYIYHYFIFSPFHYANCNWFLLPFLSWRFRTTIKRSIFLVEDCDQFICHQNRCDISSILCTVWSLLYMVSLYFQNFSVSGLCACSWFDMWTWSTSNRLHDSCQRVCSS
jgi:hypothetical protein